MRQHLKEAPVTMSVVDMLLAINQLSFMAILEPAAVNMSAIKAPITLWYTPGELTERTLVSYTVIVNILGCSQVLEENVPVYLTWTSLLENEKQENMFLINSRNDYCITSYEKEQNIGSF